MSETAVMKKLYKKLQDDKDFNDAFQASFQVAASQNIKQFNDYKIKTFDDYLVFYANLLRWTPREDVDGEMIYGFLCTFYYVIDIDPLNLNYQDQLVPEMKTPANWKGWLTSWLVQYAKEVGRWAETPASINPDSLQTFYAVPSYHMQDYRVPDGGWKTFNEFFARHIRPQVRPVDDYMDSTVIVSPVDCAFGGSFDVDDKSDIVIKNVHWNILDLLRDIDLGEKFAGGKFMHAFLGPHDYHRQHAPVRGTVKEAKVIEGMCYLEVIATPLPDGQIKLSSKRLEAPDEPGYQFVQARGVIVIDNPDIGLVAFLPVGMAQVSSIVLSVKPGDVVEKGDEVSYFQMGGSDVVMVFEKDSNVNFVVQQNDTLRYGQKIATATKKQ